MSRFQKSKGKKAKFNKKEPPRITADPDRLPPVFSFEYMPRNSGHSVDCCDQEHKAAVASRLFLLSQMNWLDIKQAPRHGVGTEKIPRGSMRANLPASVTEDANLLALRYHGLCPMVGYRDGRIFYILFIDHDFQVYDHKGS